MECDSSDVLAAAEIAAVSDLIERLGEVKAAEALGVSRVAMLRLALGRPVRRGTLALARIALAKGV